MAIQASYFSKHLESGLLFIGNIFSDKYIMIILIIQIN